METRIERFKRRVNEAMVELNTPDVIYSVGVFVHDSTDEMLHPFGIGCPGCLAKAVSDGLKEGKIYHIEKSKLHKEN